MHALVQLTTRTWLAANGELERWKQQFISNLCAEYPTGEYKNWARCQALFAHAKSAAEQKPEGESSLEEWATLLYRAAWYAFEKGSIADAEQLAVKSMKARRRMLGQEHEDTLSSIGMVGSAYNLGGRWGEAAEIRLWTMEASKRVLGADHPSTLTSMYDLASTYWNQGRWEDAEELQVQVLEARKTKLGTDHLDTLSSMNNLALTYRNQGRREDAEELFVQVLEARKSKLGGDHPSTLTSMANLASTYWNQGQWENAEELQVQVLKARKTNLGAGHPDTLTSMANLASTYGSQGRWDATEEIEIEVLETRKSKLGADHPNTLTSMVNLASTYGSQRWWEDAEELQVQVLKARKTKLGVDHPDTLVSMANLASIYRSQERWNEIEGLEVQLMESRKRLSKDNRIDENSNNISDVSDIPLLFFSSSSLDSRSSAGSFGDVRRTATQYLAILLSKDPLLRPLYMQALQELGTNRFSRNHDRLLKKFQADLRLESKDYIHLQAIRFFQNRPRREQVTAQICQLSRPHPSLADQQNMQQCLDQEEDRDYGLYRFLEAWSEEARITVPETAGGKTVEEKKDEYEDIGDTGDEAEEEDGEDDQEGLGNETEKVQIERLPHLESVVAFLTKGSSFQAFKSSLHSFVNSPTTIEEAVSCKNSKVLRQLLRKRFDIVAQGEHSWIRELDEIGYTRDEIADVLFEQANDAPWICFEPNTLDIATVLAGVHLPGCVHQFLPSEQSSPDQLATTPLHRSPSGNWRSVMKTFEELCGLAGITPTTRDLEKRDGSVRFEEQNSVAAVTCSRLSGDDDSEHHTVVSRLRNSLERFCLAAGYVQAAGLCCDSFTILYRRRILVNKFHQNRQ